MPFLQLTASRFSKATSPAAGAGAGEGAGAGAGAGAGGVAKLSGG